MIQNDCSDDVLIKIIYYNDFESFYIIFFNKMIYNDMTYYLSLPKQNDRKWFEFKKLLNIIACIFTLSLSHSLKMF